MYARKLVTIALSTMLLVGAGAAVGAATPADATAPAKTSGSADDGTAIDADRGLLAPGPSGGLPGPVPDHVSAIHDTIASFLDGGIDHLGSALGDVVGEPDSAGDR